MNTKLPKPTPMPTKGKIVKGVPHVCLIDKTGIILLMILPISITIICALYDLGVIK